MAPRNSTSRYHSPSSSSSSAHRHEQPLRNVDSVQENETNVYPYCDNKHDDRTNQIYALGVMGSSSKNHGDLSPTSTITHQRTNTNGDMKNGFVAQEANHTIYVDSGEADAIVATANDLDGEEGSIRAGVVYRTYKRRWFGLVQLTLLNIIVSWDVSTLWFSPSPLFLFFPVEPHRGFRVFHKQLDALLSISHYEERSAYAGGEPRTIRFICLGLCLGVLQQALYAGHDHGWLQHEGHKPNISAVVCILSARKEQTGRWLNQQACLFIATIKLREATE